MTQIDKWDDCVKKICGNFITEPQRNTPFIGDMELVTQHGLEVVHIQTNAKKIERPLSSCQDDKYFFVILQQQGSMGLSSVNGEQLLLKSGEMALIDSSTRYSMFPQGKMQQISVHIPKDTLSYVQPRYFPKLTKLSGSHISNQILLNTMFQLAQTQPEHLSYSQEEGEAVQHAISALIRPILNKSDSSASLSTLKDMAKSHILKQLSDETLSPDTIAHELRISKRTLYRLFEEDNMSVSRHILQLRIEKSCLDLSSDNSVCSSITDIAYRWGFSDTSQFSRAFKRIKGVTPSQWKERFKS